MCKHISFVHSLLVFCSLGAVELGQALLTRSHFYTGVNVSFQHWHLNIYVPEVTESDRFS